MQITKKLRRSLATLLLSAGLVYPACAAVCPKGIGGCTSPGRCFLFVDADKNSLCDYTGRTGTTTGGTGTTQPSPPSDSAAAATTTSPPGTATSAVQGTTGTGISDIFHASSVMIGIFLFILITGVLYLGLRKGIMGVKVEKTGPALALSALFALGIALMASCIIGAGEIPGMVFALAYIGAGSLLTAYLWHEGAMSRRIIMALAALSTLTGFVFLSPIMPLEFIGLVNTVTGASALTAGVVLLCAVIVLAALVGRTFCGHLCPVGSLQELAWAVPGKKIDIRTKSIPEVVRLSVFVLTIVAALCLVDLMAFTGLYELFSLAISAVLVIALGLVLLSVVLYRPVCRLICPFGVIFSLFAQFSRFQLQRTKSCIGCRRCEKACPAHTAGADDAKRECYLCGRCTDTCPVRTALTYDR
jgi:NAD-dependent dihydropyrimidine dehydrogenase PreA subunit